MDNKKTMNYWEKIAQNQPSEKSVKVKAANDFTSLDAEFILKYAGKGSSILDLASGTGLIINKIYPHVSSITAVEKFPEFSKFIKSVPSVNVVNSNLLSFKTNEKFDLITLFGIVQYFSEDEINYLYNKCKTWLKENGTLIIKNQFGVNEDVVVSGFSEELNTDYFSEYRHLDKEMYLLKKNGFTITEVVDIYPKECNRWDNTHFYAIVAV